MRSSEQTKVIIQAMKDDIERRRTMSPDEKRKIAKHNLQAIGVLDQEGNVIDNYKGVFVRAQ